MECPVCSYRLKRATSKNIVVDVCTHCSGIWFDSGELQVFLRELVKSDKITPQKTRLFQPRDIETSDQSTQKIRMCPKCGLVMKTFNYAYDSNVFVDKCPECEGIWTDAGEAKEIAGHLKEDPKAKFIGHDIVKHQQSLNELEEWADLAGKFAGPVSFLWLFMPKIIIPLGDDNERTKFPAITLSIIVLCCAIFLFQMFGVNDHETFFHRFGFVPTNFWSIGLITSMFLHGGILHLLGNMYFLWIFGDNIEDRLGHWWYIVFYLAGDFAASILHTLFNMGSDIPSIGASGAISAVMGAYFVFYPQARLKLFCICRVISIPSFIYLLIWFLFQLLFGAIAFSNEVSYGIGWFAHIGGFAFGMLIAYLVKKSNPNPQD